MTKWYYFGQITLDFLFNIIYNHSNTAPPGSLVMNEAKKFGIRLRELRVKAGMTLRELANAVNIDFTYLSKIENGIMPPPSEKVLLQLAEALNTDQDELLTLAGRIPPDIAEILKDPEALAMLRSKHVQKKSEPSGWKGVKMPRPSATLKTLYRVAIPLILVIAVATSLWFATPTKALTIDYPTLPSGNVGSTHSGQVVITIEDNEHLPVQSINMEIYNVADSTKKATCTYLPTTATTKNYSSAQTGNGGAVAVTATTGFGWQYVTKAGYADWKGSAYTWLPMAGYGYAYSPGSVSITYDITWSSPSGWPSGDYKIKTEIIANGNTFTEYSGSFTLVAATGGGSVPATKPGATNVTNAVNMHGEFNQTVTATSADGNISMTINRGTTGKDKHGQTLREILIVPSSTPPAPPPQANIIGLPYNFGPDGATFDPPITITFTYDPATIPEGVEPGDLVIAFWDENTNQWVKLDNIVVDPVSHTISGETSHFTTFSVIAHTGPAGFTFSQLNVTPTDATAGDMVTIEVTVTNTGDLNGDCEVILKIGDEVSEVRQVTVAGHSSQQVSFTTTMADAGSYTVDVNGLAGTMTVLPAAGPAPEPTTPPSPPVQPAPAPPAPAPEPPTPAPTVPAPVPPSVTPEPSPEAQAFNWWYVGGGIIGAIILITIVTMLVVRRRE